METEHEAFLKQLEAFRKQLVDLGIDYAEITMAYNEYNVLAFEHKNRQFILEVMPGDEFSADTVTIIEEKEVYKQEGGIPAAALPPRALNFIRKKILRKSE